MFRGSSCTYDPASLISLEICHLKVGRNLSQVYGEKFTACKLFMPSTLLGLFQAPLEFALKGQALTKAWTRSFSGSPVFTD